ncbi:MAG: hypothetical protein GY913_22065 [Proteobacteria bacterium]|nr:hypothetical protein [Pseudomonadota bacterium]MCP4919597.1 hypothetical protein [Pseudomonadota bacterium]
MRLLRDARGGVQAALAELWEGSLDEVWSIARALLGEADAIDALRVLREQVVSRAPGLSTDRSWRDQIFELLWGGIADRMQPGAEEGIHAERGDVMSASFRPRSGLVPTSFRPRSDLGTTKRASACAPSWGVPPARNA